MKGILTLLSLLALAVSVNAGDFKLYATLLGETPVELSDGAKWMMDKGDVFPVLMYKESHTKMVLQLAGATFMVDAALARILKSEEVPAGLVVYRKNVELYLSGKADKWRAGVEPKKPAEEPAKP